MLEVFKILIYVFFGLAAFFLLLTVMEYFLFRIPDVRAELTGKNVRRAIKKMTEENRGNEVPIGRGLTGTLKQGASSNISGSLDDGMIMTASLVSPKTAASSAGRTSSGLSSYGKAASAAAGRMKITKEVLIIHTEEKIEL